METREELSRKYSLDDQAIRDEINRIRKKPTNIERLREMSDSELTEEIYRLMGNAAKCPDCFWKSGRERLELYLKMECK